MTTSYQENMAISSLRIQKNIYSTSFSLVSPIDCLRFCCVLVVICSCIIKPGTMRKFVFIHQALLLYSMVVPVDPRTGDTPTTCSVKARMKTSTLSENEQN